MVLKNQKYSATIPKEEATPAGLEYYIEAMDNAVPSNIIYRDQSGNSKAVPGPDTDINIQIQPLPKIIEYSPKNINVPINSSIIIKFNVDMEMTSTENSFSISPYIPGQLTCAFNRLIYTPSEPLSYDTIYTVSISKTARDTNGYYLDDDYEWTFVTAVEDTGVQVEERGEISIFALVAIIAVIVIVIIIVVVFLLVRKKKQERGTVGFGAGYGFNPYPGMAQTPSEAVQHARAVESEIQKQLEPIIPVETSSYYSKPQAPQPKSVLGDQPPPTYPKYSEPEPLPEPMAPPPPMAPQPAIPIIPQAQPINVTAQPMQPQVQVSRMCKKCGATVMGNYVCPFCGG
jgi:hypothetical protein